MRRYEMNVTKMKHALTYDIMGKSTIPIPNLVVAYTTLRNLSYQNLTRELGLFALQMKFLQRFVSYSKII